MGSGVCMGVQEYDNLNVSSPTSDNPHYYKLFHNYLIDFPIIKLTELQHIRVIPNIVQAQGQSIMTGIKCKCNLINLGKVVQLKQASNLNTTGHIEECLVDFISIF